MNVKHRPYSKDPIPAMRTVDKPATVDPINPAVTLAGMGAATPVADIIEVPVMEGCKGVKIGTAMEVSFRHIFEVNGHNYLFISNCCMDCIKVKHKKMLRAYLIDHGTAPGLRLWWKIWRATR